MKLFGVKDSGVWLEALSDFAPEDLSYGFKKVLKSISEKERDNGECWPPNVKEFRMLCERRLSDYGLPDVHRAFNEYEKNEWRPNPQWTHPLVAEAAKHFKPDPENHRGILFSGFSAIYEALVRDFLYRQE